MSTEYDIRCKSPENHLGGRDRWGEVRRYQVPALFALIDQRECIVALGEIDGGVDVTLLGSQGGSMVEFFGDHATCDLGVFDEYGEEEARVVADNDVAEGNVWPRESDADLAARAFGVTL